MYEFADAAVLRAAGHRSGVDIAWWPDLTGSAPDQVEQWRAWLQWISSDRWLAAVELASPALAQRVQSICAGTPHQERQIRKAVLSMVRYVLRATSRATPFGLFAGILPARLGRPAAGRVGENHRAVARVDAAWLAEVITRLEGVPQLLARLPVIASNLAVVRDTRLVIACQQQPGTSGDPEPAEVSIRHTSAVRAIMRGARTPIRVSDLASALSAQFPDTPTATINRTVTELVACRFLITSMRPALTAPDPLHHLVTALAAVAAHTVADAAELVNSVYDIHTELTQHTLTSQDPSGDLSPIAHTMTTLAPTAQPLSVDLRLEGDVVIPPAVAHEAQAAAAALVRLSAHPSGLPAWQDYHRRFCRRFGLGALVPLTLLLHPETGLGFPSGYRDSHLPPPPPQGLSERDITLLAWAQDAAMTQRTEILLDDTMITKLAVEDPHDRHVQPHTELRVRVHAPTLDALDSGEFELALVGVSRAAGTTTGRFLDLFDPHDRDRMVATYAGLPTATEDAIGVQVSCPPAYVRTENVVRTPVVLPRLLSLAEHPAVGGEPVAIDDLAVSADARRMYLVSLSQRRPVEAMVFSAVELINHAHPLARFLCEISTASTVACEPFSWGAASRLPYLPRIRVGRTILSPARWLLAGADLPDASASWETWVSRLSEWRRRYRLPTVVYLGDGDQRLRLDLDHSHHLCVLRDAVNRATHVTLREAPDATAFGWVGGRAHELVIPLAVTGNATAAPAAHTWPGRPISSDYGHLLGASDWLYIKILAHPDRHTGILITDLPHLMSTWDSQPDWWFLRYDDPEPHIRLRIRLTDPTEIGAAAQTIGSWAAGLRHRGLTGALQWDTYHPEYGRFGDDESMTAAESVFAADSAAAIAQLAASAQRDGPSAHALIAASHVDLAASFLGGTAEGMRWLVDHAASSLLAADRSLRREAIRLADPTDDGSALRAIPGGHGIAQSWTRRRVALSAYRAALTEGLSPHRVLPDLLHLHHVRMAGISPDTERTCRRLARAAALSWTTRTRATR